MKNLIFCWKKTDLSRLRILVLQSLFSYILCEINVKIGKLTQNIAASLFLTGFSRCTTVYALPTELVQPVPDPQ